MNVDTNTDKRLRTLSLFSGIGGIELGLQRWCRTVCHVELDSYAQAVLCKNMAAGNLDVAPIWDDVTTFGESEIETVGPIECITGGFPCQSYSTSHTTGKTRACMFVEMLRLVQRIRPRFVFAENVSKKAISTAAECFEAIGYDTEMAKVSAHDLGGDHLRRRYWVLAHAEHKRKLLCAIDGEKMGKLQTVGQDIWQSDPTIIRVSHGVSGWVDRIRCLGNAVVPQCAKKAFELLMEM